MLNLRGKPYTLKRDERITQFSTTPNTIIIPEYVSELGSTERGNMGFGSTGVE